ncbi:MAG: hypothetical protein HWE07_05785 [Cytophagia bacterium]|nr:hypothetical protein [Cytophagia bacterium]
MVISLNIETTQGFNMTGVLNSFSEVYRVKGWFRILKQDLIVQMHEQGECFMNLKNELFDVSFKSKSKVLKLYGCKISNEYNILRVDYRGAKIEK